MGVFLAEAPASPAVGEIPGHPFTQANSDSGVWDAWVLLAYDRAYTAALGAALLPLSAAHVGERCGLQLLRELRALREARVGARGAALRRSFGQFWGAAVLPAVLVAAIASWLVG